MKGISYSQISMYLNCPYAWKLKYVDEQTTDEPSIFTMFGTAMHETIQYWLTHFRYASNTVRCNTRDYNSNETTCNTRDYTLSDKKEFDYETFLFDTMQRLHETAMENHTEDFTSPEQLAEFYIQGIAIMKDLFIKQNKLFPLRNIELINIEQELNYPLSEHIRFNGYIDIVLHDKKTNMYRIIDIKTSYKGWKNELKDEKRKMQLCLYKEFYAKQYNVPLDNIVIEYLIIKRNIFVPENVTFKISRIQHVVIPSGKIILNKHRKTFKTFLEQCYPNLILENKEFYDNLKPNPSPQNCKYCSYKNKQCTIKK